MLKRDLLEVAMKLGLDVNAKSAKGDILKALREAQEAQKSAQKG